MKKVLLMALALCCLQYIGNAQVARQPEKSSQKCAEAQAKCQKEISSCSKRAKYYQKLAAKADQQGNKNLADVYTKCANAKQKIADGLKKIYETAQTCQKICSGNPEIKSAICEKGGFKCVIGKRKKRMRVKAHMKKMKQCVALCLQNAKQAKQDGKSDLASQYNKLATAVKGKTEGCELTAEGKKEFKAARKELKATSKEKNTKKEE